MLFRKITYFTEEMQAFSASYEYYYYFCPDFYSLL